MLFIMKKYGSMMLCIGYSLIKQPLVISHLRMVLDILCAYKLYDEVSKYNFWLKK